MRIGPSIGIPGDAAAVAASFSPAMLNGLILWLRADLGITLNGGNVSQWNDQSTAGNHVSQGTAANQPVFNATDAAFNSRPSVQFDGVDDVLSRAATNLAGDYSIFFVIRWAAVAAAFQFLVSNTSAGTGGFEGGTTSTSVRGINHAGVGTGNDAAPTVGVSEIVSNLFASGTAAELYVNGASQSLSTSPTTINSAAGGSLNIGGRDAASLPAPAKTPEIIWYNRKLSTSERRIVEAYLGARYGIAV